MKVICTLPNASELISGVKFKSVPGVGMVSEEIDDEQAELFLSINGYEVAEDEEEVETPPVPKPASPKPAAAPKAPKADKAAAKAAEAPAATEKAAADEKEAADPAATTETPPAVPAVQSGEAAAEETF